MKKILLILLFPVMAGCDTSDIPGDVITHEFERISFVLPRASWSIDRYISEGNDKTEELTPLIFHFKNDDSFIAEFPEFNGTGSWRYESFPGKSEKLFIESPAPANELSDSWKILSIVNAEIKLGRRDIDTIIFKRRDSI